MSSRNMRMGAHTPTEIMKPLLLVLTLWIVSSNLMAQAPSIPQGAMTHSLGTSEFTLSNEKKNCQIQVVNKSASEAQTIELLIESPCYWITGSKPKALLHYSYESISVDATLLVAGTPLDWPAEKKTYQKLPDDSYCTQFLQGIVVSKKKVFAVNEKMIAAHCETGLAIDEKIFYAMAHNPDRYTEKIPDAKEKKANSTAVIKDASSATEATLKPKGSEEKSFIDSVTDTIKGLFSGEDNKDAK